MLIEKEMSGWVKAKYWTLPTTLQYSWGSLNVVLSKAINLAKVDMRVKNGLAFCMFVLGSKWLLHLDSNEEALSL